MITSRDPPAATAWALVLIVGAASALVAIVLGPPLGRLLAPPRAELFSGPALDFVVQPEPTELARALIVVASPLLIAAAIVWRAQAQADHGPGWLINALAIVAQAICLALALVALGKREIDFGDLDLATFSVPALVFATALAVALLAAARSERARTAATRVDRATRHGLWGRALAAAVVAVTVIFLLPAVFTEEGLARADPYVWTHLQVLFEDFAALDNGLTPMVDYAAQYTQLLPYLIDPLLSLVGFGPAQLTVILSLLSLASLLALYAILRLAISSRLAAALLYLPVLAAGSMPLLDAGDERVYNANVYQLMPIRYVGPLAIGWLLARRLAGRWAPGRTALFALSGLVAINNPEFGLPTFVALGAGLLLADRDPAEPIRLGDCGRLVLQALNGALIAIAVASVITLVRSGELPDPEMATLLGRALVGQGFFMVPIGSIGLFVVVYLTLGGAVVVAGARAAAGSSDRTLTGMLAFAGTLGLGAGLYFAGRSLPEGLLALYPLWGLAAALLAWLVLRSVAAHESGAAAISRVGAGGLIAVVCIGLMATALVEVPAPWKQVERLSERAEARSPLDVGPAAAFVERFTAPGDEVAFLTSMGHFTAREAGVHDVSPINSVQHVISVELLDRVLDPLEQRGGELLFTTDPTLSHDSDVGPYPRVLYPLWTGIADELGARGWKPVATDPASHLTAWRRKLTAAD